MGISRIVVPQRIVVCDYTGVMYSLSLSFVGASSIVIWGIPILDNPSMYPFNLVKS